MGRGGSGSTSTDAVSRTPSVIGSLARIDGQKILRACRAAVLETDHQLENRSIVQVGAKASGLGMPRKIAPKIGCFET